MYEDHSSLRASHEESAGEIADPSSSDSAVDESGAVHEGGHGELWRGTAQPLLAKQKQQLFDLMVEHGQGFAIMLLDLDGCVVSWNTGAQRILGYQEAEIVGRHFSHFFTTEDVEAGRPQHELDQALKTGKCEDDNWLVRKDGSRFFASGLTTVLRDGRVHGYSKIFRDLTERKQLEDTTQKRAEELAETNRRKDEFLAMLAHELRNPMAPILNALQIMRHDRSDNPLAQQARTIIERQVRHMTRLIDDLLDAARISQGKIELRCEAVEASVILDRALETNRPLIEARGHRVSVSVPREPLWLYADPNRLEQAIGNLVTNAAKYTPRGGRVWLSAMQERNRIIFKVRDSGVGIAQDLLPHVFQLFTQGPRTRDRSEGGLGIGLTLVKSLVEMHGGTVSAHSDGTGRGSELTVELPKMPVAPAALPPTSQTQTPKQVASLKVLIVDDSIDAADSLALLLTLEGYEVQTANDGIRAVPAALDLTPDVVFLDIGLPGADGYTVAKRMRELPQLEGLMLVAMTGYGQEKDRELSREAGFDHHLVKPVDPEQLRQLLVHFAQSKTL
jgi:PAS domain S-box-containing protein